MWSWQGGEAGSEYLAGYLLERSLSLDNLFVFAVLFSYFAVPADVQPRVLSWGIALALVLRLVFILLGAALLGSFHITFYAFGSCSSTRRTSSRATTTPRSSRSTTRPSA